MHSAKYSAWALNRRGNLKQNLNTKQQLKIGGTKSWNQEMRRLQTLGLQYRIGVCTPAVYVDTCTFNGGDLSAVDIVYGWKVKG